MHRAMLVGQAIGEMGCAQGAFAHDAIEVRGILQRWPCIAMRVDHAHFETESFARQPHGEQEIRVVGNDDGNIAITIEAIDQKECCEIDVRSLLLGDEDPHRLRRG